jgi:hypothetical protein
MEVISPAAFAGGQEATYGRPRSVLAPWGRNGQGGLGLVAGAAVDGPAVPA